MRLGLNVGYWGMGIGREDQLAAFADAARQVQELYLRGHRQEAAAALPDELIDMVSLCGPAGAVRDRLHLSARPG